MNSDESEDLLEWDKKNITRFAQYLYNLAKEKVLEEKAKAAEEVTKEAPIVKSIDETEAKKIERKIVLEEATLGLAKAVSGEEIEQEELTVKVQDQEELQEIIEKEQIPLPAEDVITIEEPPEKQPDIIKASDILSESEMPQIPLKEIGIEEQIKNLEPVDLSQPIVTEPVIDEKVFVKPEHIPEEVHKMVFIDEATSVPITEEEIVPLETGIQEEVAPADIEAAAPVDEPRIEIITPEPEPEPEPESIVEIQPEEPILEQVQEAEIVSVPEPEEIEKMEVVTEPSDTGAVVEEKVEVILDLDEEQIKRRDEIIQQMLAETKEREKQEDFQIRDMGETEGRAYSAVVFGQESSKNVKKWRKWERNKEKREKKLAKREARKKKK
jgi:hypothetical protein